MGRVRIRRATSSELHAFDSARLALTREVSTEACRPWNNQWSDAVAAEEVSRQEMLASHAQARIDRFVLGTGEKPQHPLHGKYGAHKSRWARG